MKGPDRARPRREVWRELLQQQETSGLSVRAFCQQHGVSEHSFYQWRKRWAEAEPVRFALVDPKGAIPRHSVAMELVLAGGDRLQIATGVDPSTLRTVLAVLRERA